MKCFYHNDSDGKSAGFWVYSSVEVTDEILGYESEFIEIDYRMRFPIETIKPSEQVYIVDFSITPNEMRELLKITKNVTWIDHHKTAIEKYADFEHDIRGIRFDGIAGCMLTYCYLHHMTQRGQGDIKPFSISMTENAPIFTKLIADWDVWKFDYGNDTRYFQTAFRAYDFEPTSEEWLKFFKEDNFEQTMIEEGIIMTRYRDSWAKEYMKIGFETIFEGCKCYAVNLGMANSEYFKSLPLNKYDILMPFSFDGEQFKVSMYSQTVDVSEIAIKYGGGGHKGASGFQCKVLPFEKRVENKNKYTKATLVDKETDFLTLIKDLEGKIIDINTDSQCYVDPFEIDTSGILFKRGFKNLAEYEGLCIKFMNNFQHLVMFANWQEKNGTKKELLDLINYLGL